jgi:ribonuclease Z
MMIDNLPLKTIKYEDFTIEGYSRAAVQSYWRIPELKLCFDLGGSPWSFTGTSTIFITHAHLDHLAAIPVFVARRRMMRMEPPTIYLPKEAVQNVRRILDLWQRLDRGRMACELIGVEPGDELELSREHVVTVFQTKHTVTSVGYIVWDRRKKLKQEYRDLSGEEIRDIRKSGKDVSEEFRFPLVCYTGDTAPAGLDNDPAVYQAKILITELTFFRPEHRKDKIHKFGHMHLDDFLERAELFQNERILLAHFSTRYHENQIRKAIQNKLPANLKDRVVLWL